jgi:DNA invertase Pin-like site-specific DNA recombinase
MLKAFGYLRVSGKDQIDGDGFTRQRAAIATYAKSHDYQIVAWFEERAIPGKTEWDQRPSWMEMIGQLNGTRTIFVEKLDRLARDLMVQEHIIADLRGRRVDLVSVGEPDLCVDDPGRKLLRQIMGAIAEYDRAMITAKLAGARKRSKVKTGRCEGRKPYGHKPGELAVITRMRELRSAGVTFEAIAVSLNRESIKTRSGLSWIGATVQKILKRARVCA